MENSCIIWLLSLTLLGSGHQRGRLRHQARDDACLLKVHFVRRVIIVRPIYLHSKYMYTLNIFCVRVIPGKKFINDSNQKLHMLFRRIWFLKFYVVIFCPFASFLTPQRRQPVARMPTFFQVWYVYTLYFVYSYRVLGKYFFYAQYCKYVFFLIWTHSQ